MKTLLQSTVVLLTVTLAASPLMANHILGIDVSEYQGSVNWTSVHNAGVTFAFAKATEGNYIEDPDYKNNMANGKAAGLEMGAYDFAHPYANTPATEANYYWAFASTEFGDGGETLMPMLDLEEFSGVVGASTYTAWANDWSADVKAKETGWQIRPIIYISACNACELNSGIGLSPFIADYNGENLYTGTPWSTCTGCEVWGSGNWSFWQVSDSGSVPGISGAVDLDAYIDSLADLKAWQAILPN